MTDKHITNGAGGVQALSAAPAEAAYAARKLRDEIQRLAMFADQAARMDQRTMRDNLETLAEELTNLLAASPTPTPPAEQQAAPKAAPGDALDEVMRERDEAEDFINELLDEVLGADRPEWSSAYNRYDAMSDVRERITALHKPAVDKAWGQFQSAMAAPQQEPVYQARYKGGDWQDSCRKRNEYLKNPELSQAKDWELRVLYAAPQPAPAELEQLRERISRIGLDVDRAMRGHVNEQSPLGTQRLAAIAALAKPAPAPLSDEREAFESTWEHLYGKKPVLWDTAFKEAKMDVPAHSAGKYFYRDAQAAWKAWQARAALAAQGGA